MVSELKVGKMPVDVVLKDIKNVHLSVHPPAGRVRVSAPARMSLDTIRVFVISKLDWIRQQQQKLRAQERETAREYLDRESHYVWGRRYLLEVTVSEEPSGILLKPGRMIMTVRPGTKRAGRDQLLARWYRDEVRATLPPFIAKWEPILGVKIRQCFVQQMKTKWGSCNPGATTIRLNTELAKKPKDCLEYVVLHEMVHLIEPTHGHRFVVLMDQVMPRWRVVQQKLNQLPVKHEDWTY
jgi:predicted metal-dependent hydrolase